MNMEQFKKILRNLGLLYTVEGTTTEYGNCLRTEELELSFEYETPDSFGYIMVCKNKAPHTTVTTYFQGAVNTTAEQIRKDFPQFFETPKPINMKTVKFTGTDEQIKNLRLLLEHGDNDLPKEYIPHEGKETSTTRDEFMEYFRSDDYNNELSSDDCMEVFVTSVKGSSDLTVDVFNEILADYGCELVVQDVKDMPPLLKQMNWEMLRHQKITLLGLLDNVIFTEKTKGDLKGILHLIDAIQDTAVDLYGMNEEVFNKVFSNVTVTDNSKVNEGLLYKNKMLKENIEQVKKQVSTGIKLGRIDRKWGSMIVETCDNTLKQ